MECEFCGDSEKIVLWKDWTNNIEYNICVDCNKDLLEMEDEYGEKYVEGEAKLKRARRIYDKKDVLRLEKELQEKNPVKVYYIRDEKYEDSNGNIHSKGYTPWIFTSDKYDVEIDKYSCSCDFKSKVGNLRMSFPTYAITVQKGGKPPEGWYQ